MKKAINVITGILFIFFVGTIIGNRMAERRVAMSEVKTTTTRRVTPAVEKVIDSVAQVNEKIDIRTEALVNNVSESIENIAKFDSRSVKDQIIGDSIENVIWGSKADSAYEALVTKVSQKVEQPVDVIESRRDSDYKFTGSEVKQLLVENNDLATAKKEARTKEEKEKEYLKTIATKDSIVDNLNEKIQNEKVARDKIDQERRTLNDQNIQLTENIQEAVKNENKESAGKFSGNVWKYAVGILAGIIIIKSID
ncbi:MAG: hypothetical protein ACYDEX_19125 [Mobilitalea sp.]